MAGRPQKTRTTRSEGELVDCAKVPHVSNGRAWGVTEDEDEDESDIDVVVDEVAEDCLVGAGRSPMEEKGDEFLLPCRITFDGRDWRRWGVGFSIACLWLWVGVGGADIAAEGCLIGFGVSNCEFGGNKFLISFT